MTEFRKIFDGVADESKTYEMMNLHNNAPFDERRWSGELYAGEWFEVSEAVYWYFLEVLPPIYIPHGFAVCEAIAGAVYRCFFKFHISGEDRYFCAACDRRANAPTRPGLAAAHIFQATSPARADA